MNHNIRTWQFITFTDSPFHPKIVDPTRVRVSGGWRPLLDEHERIPLIVNKEKQIPFDASEAGPGELTAEVHGPSYKVPTAIDSRVGGKHILIFTPQEEGKYLTFKYTNNVYYMNGPPPPLRLA